MSFERSLRVLNKGKGIFYIYFLKKRQLNFERGRFSEFPKMTFEFGHVSGQFGQKTVYFGFNPFQLGGGPASPPT